jgi:predicted DNA-binding transcriptional regulator AlpA
VATCESPAGRALADIKQRWLYRNDVCDAIGVSYRVLSAMIADGRFARPDSVVNGRPRWARSTVQDWLERTRPKGAGRDGARAGGNGRGLPPAETIPHRPTI